MAGYRSAMKTPSIKNAIARKTVKATAKHTVSGTASKLKRNPVRAVTLFGIGALTGAAAGWLLGRNGSQPEPQSV